MNNDFIENKLRSLFLSSPNNNKGLVFIDGEWGVGKTFFWKTRIASALSSKKKKNLYIPLFGIKTVQELKRKILSEYLAYEAEEKKILPFLQRLNLDKIALPAWNLASKSIGVNIELDICDFIPPCIICFDDLERISSNANIQEILGYINYLCEHKNFLCTIIFNSTEIKECQKEDFDKYKEKMSLTFIHFKPDLKPIIDLIWERREKPVSNEVQAINSLIQQNSLTNLRVIQSIVNLFSELKEADPRELNSAQLKFFVSAVQYSATSTVNIDFFDFEPFLLPLTPEGQDDPLAEKREQYFNQFYSQSEYYKPYKSILGLILNGYLDTSHYKKELFERCDIKDPVSRRISEIDNIHLFLSSETEANKLRREILTLLEIDRTFSIKEISLLTKKLSSISEMIDITKPSALPSELHQCAVKTFKDSQDLPDSDFSRDISLNSMNSCFGNELTRLLEKEKADRAVVDFNDAFDRFDFTTVNRLLNSHPFLLATQDIYNKIKGLYANLEFPTDFKYRVSEKALTILNNKTSPSPDWKKKYDEIKDHFIKLYDAESDEIEKLRLYRLLEALDTIPDTKPLAIRN